jgi:polar amino acid transport system substrate-binding protein
MKRWITILALLLPVAALGEEPNKNIKISVFFYPPLLIEEKGEEPGLYVELARHLFAQEGYKTEFQLVAFLRAMQGTESCEYDAIGAINSQNSSKVLLSRTIPLKLRFSFWVKKGSPWVYRGLGSLKGKKVAHVRGYNYKQASAEYQAFLERHPEQVHLISGEQTTQRIFEMITGDRIDLFNIDHPQAVWTMEKYKLRGELKEAGALPNALDAHIAFCPNERGEKLRSLFDSSLKKHGRSAKVREIYRKYGLEKEWEQMRATYSK